MPKTQGRTVAEHRSVQHRAVLEATERLIVKGHGRMPSVGEVAAEVGLARSSIYRYASSQHDLLVQLLVNATDTWNEKLEARLRAVPADPAERICAYVDAALDLFANGSHGPLMVAVQNFPEAFTDEKVQASHAGFNTVLDELCPGVSPLDFSLLNAAVLRAAELVAESADRKADYAQATATLHRMAEAVAAGRA